jgi:15-cis-phytoene synthase
MAEFEVALAYAPAAIRPAYRALSGLDGRLAAAVASVREPQMGLIRLKWWEEALAKLPATDAAAVDPLLDELAMVVRNHDVNPNTLSRLTHGWAELFAPFPLDDAALDRFARDRGGGLFAMAAKVAGEDSEIAASAGEAWALYDLTTHVSDATTSRGAMRLAESKPPVRLPRRLSTLAILGAWARLDAMGGASPRQRALAAMRIALIGR